MICETCGNLIEDCECERDEPVRDIEIEIDDIFETGYDGDGY